MNVSLTPKLEKLVNRKVESGLYNSASEVIREALRLLEERDRLREIRIEERKKKIADGVEDLDSGRSKSFDEKAVNSVQARDRRKLGGRRKTKQA